MAYPDTMLARMFSSSAEIAKKGPDGAYFLDRNPDLFSVILEFYRNKTLIVPKNTPLQSLYNELTYFGIDFDEDDIQIADEPKHVPVDCYISLMNAYKVLPHKGHLLGNVIMGLPEENKYTVATEEENRADLKEQYEALGAEPNKNREMGFSIYNLDLEGDSFPVHKTSTDNENSPPKKKHKQIKDKENGPYDETIFDPLKAIQGLLTSLSADSAFCVGGVYTIPDNSSLAIKPLKQEKSTEIKPATSNIKPICEYRNWCHITTKEHAENFFHPPSILNDNNNNQTPIYYIQAVPINHKIEDKINCGTLKDLNVELIKNMCTPAPYGDLKTMTTKIDPNVRLALECDSNRFTINIFLGEVSEYIRAKLNSNKPIELKPYKLNIYEPGGFFKEHVDTPVNPGDMIGSLVVCLPSEHEGGELIVSHNGVSKTFDFAINSGNKNVVQWAAFYSDCIHEVKPVTKGTRITVTFLIENKKDPNDWERRPPQFNPTVVRNFFCGPSDMEKNVTRAKNIVEILNDLPASIVKIGLFLSHKYTATAMRMETLKGSDKVLVDKLGAKWDYYLTSVIYNEYRKRYMDQYTDMYIDQNCRGGAVYAFSMEDLKFLCGKGPRPDHILTRVPFIMSTQKGRLLYHNEDEGAEHTGNDSRPAESDSVYFHATVILVRK
eukprot:Phypoly_transcript_04246.p1 GENE.Phypoly_transcript_04246~~Phypoly_transcript_04246.p1  ORF type:complete len:721 (+),score=97.05 Phypoly_transcript_04246:173-2164(+)